MVDSILQAGIQGVQNGLDQFGRASQNIASSASQNVLSQDASSGNPAPASSLVEVKHAQHTVETATKVIASADQTVATLLDELA